MFWGRWFEVMDTRSNTLIESASRQQRFNDVQTGSYKGLLSK